MGAQRCEWLGALLHRMLNPAHDDDTSKAVSASRLATLERLSHQMVGQLMERLLQLEERDVAAQSPEQLGNLMHCLSLFCTARPQLLLPHIDVLIQFLTYEHAVGSVRHDWGRITPLLTLALTLALTPTQVMHICEMIPPLLQIVDHPPSAMLAKVETFFRPSRSRPLPLAPSSPSPLAYRRQKRSSRRSSSGSRSCSCLRPWSRSR